MKCCKCFVLNKGFLGVLIFMTLATSGILAQSAEESSQENKNSISLSIGHAFIDQGLIEGQNTWLAEPSIMLDYNHHFNSRWFVGVHSDIVLQSFEVIRSSDQSILERSYPICVVAVGGFKPNEFLVVAVGSGIELEEKEHLGVIRISVESGFRISKSWEVPLSLTYDYKLTGYSSLVLGIGFAKTF